MQITIERLGSEQTPVVIIDEMPGNPQALIETAENAQWLRENPYYPGIRAQVPQDYLSPLLQQAAIALRRGFGIDTQMGLASKAISNAFCCFSMVTRAPETLKPLQSLPHFDATTGRQLAMLHYLCEPPFQGTRFFRHRPTGFENILDHRVAEYQQVAGAHLEQVRPGYASECEEWYQHIGEVEARWNRVVFYPASLLHSGIVDPLQELPDSARQGRLTITGFIDLAEPLQS